jgi:hypothetical protein
MVMSVLKACTCARMKIEILEESMKGDFALNKNITLPPFLELTVFFLHKCPEGLAYLYLTFLSFVNLRIRFMIIPKHTSDY